MKKKRMIDSLRKKAERDPLTNLYNKAAIQHLVEQYLAAHPDDQCALLMIDIDNFKFANDTMGHLFGDVLLTDLSASICGETRVSDLVGRVGGDEFPCFAEGRFFATGCFPKIPAVSGLWLRSFSRKNTIFPFPAVSAFPFFRPTAVIFEACISVQILRCIKRKEKGKILPVCILRR